MAAVLSGVGTSVAPSLGGLFCEEGPTGAIGVSRRCLAILPRRQAMTERSERGAKAGCPSGQWELTVNQPRNATGVRIPHPPPWSSCSGRGQSRPTGRSRSERGHEERRLQQRFPPA